MARTSLKMLADHLHLSQGTVSRALNGYTDISAATRLRVRDAARDMGYAPNPTARRLATGIAEAVAYVMPQRGDSMSESFVTPLLQGLGEALAGRGWDLLIVQAATVPEEVAALRRLTATRQIGGVVLSRPRKSDARIDFLRGAGFPFVVHGRSEGCAAYAWYDVDSRAAFAEAVGRLAALGHRRIGFVGAPLHFTFAQDRRDGYRAALAAHGLDVDPGLEAVAALDDTAGEAAAAALLSRDPAPTALLCATDPQALGALAAIRARGMVPGRDVSVIGYDGLSIGRHANPPLSTMAQPQADSGRRLGEMLLALVDGGAPTDYQELHRAEFLRRDTDGPAPESGPPNNHREKNR